MTRFEINDWVTNLNPEGLLYNMTSQVTDIVHEDCDSGELYQEFLVRGFTETFGNAGGVVVCKSSDYPKVELPTLKKLYLAGSLRNESMPAVRDFIEDVSDFSVFMDWYAVGPRADDHWKSYWSAQDVSYQEALTKPISQNIFHFDKEHIDASDVMVLVAPAGKSAHLELGYFIGKGGTGIYYFPEEEDIRWDVMVNFATEVVVGPDQLKEVLKRYE